MTFALAERVVIRSIGFAGAGGAVWFMAEVAYVLLEPIAEPMVKAIICVLIAGLCHASLSRSRWS